MHPLDAFRESLCAGRLQYSVRPTSALRQLRLRHPTNHLCERPCLPRLDQHPEWLTAGVERPSESLHLAALVRRHRRIPELCRTTVDIVPRMRLPRTGFVSWPQSDHGSREFALKACPFTRQSRVMLEQMASCYPRLPRPWPEFVQWLSVRRAWSNGSRSLPPWTDACLPPFPNR